MQVVAYIGSMASLQDRWYSLQKRQLLKETLKQWKISFVLLMSILKVIFANLYFHYYHWLHLLHFSSPGFSGTESPPSCSEPENASKFLSHLINRQKCKWTDSLYSGSMMGIFNFVPTDCSCIVFSYLSSQLQLFFRWKLRYLSILPLQELVEAFCMSW